MAGDNQIKQNNEGRKGKDNWKRKNDTIRGWESWNKVSTHVHKVGKREREDQKGRGMKYNMDPVVDLVREKGH